MEQESPSSQREYVYWLSRHPLTAEQWRVLEFLHGPTIAFKQKDLRTSLDEFLSALEVYCNYATVYLVAPQVFMDTASRLGYCFRRFGSVEEPNDGRFHLRCVYEYRDGRCSVVLDYQDLQRLDLLDESLVLNNTLSLE